MLPLFTYAVSSFTAAVCCRVFQVYCKQKIDCGVRNDSHCACSTGNYLGVFIRFQKNRQWQCRGDVLRQSVSAANGKAQSPMAVYSLIITTGQIFDGVIPGTNRWTFFWPGTWHTYNLYSVVWERGFPMTGRYVLVIRSCRHVSVYLSLRHRSAVNAACFSVVTATWPASRPPAVSGIFCTSFSVPVVLATVRVFSFQAPCSSVDLLPSASQPRSPIRQLAWKRQVGQGTARCYLIVIVLCTGFAQLARSLNIWEWELPLENGGGFCECLGYYYAEVQHRINEFMFLDAQNVLRASAKPSVQTPVHICIYVVDMFHAEKTDSRWSSEDRGPIRCCRSYATCLVFLFFAVGRRERQRAFVPCIRTSDSNAVINNNYIYDSRFRFASNISCRFRRKSAQQHS